MTDRPYTNDDLRAEAANQHANLTEDPDFLGIGEQMHGRVIESTVVDLEPETGEPLEMGRAWHHLSEDQFEAAQRKIHDLITGAADLSEWAVNLGADGLEPDGTLQLGVRGPNPGDPEQPVVRLHFAFPKGMSHDDRSHLLMRLSGAMAKAL
ncbi:MULTISPECIES: hypothetical protein [unclassified Streptomyces]|uniref:hypothetical protein n=1 Tax=unclassified Streptomyces TaxID=2593676 RepID=UPI001F172079|nr:MULTISPECIES: hypothetical protein [unclassified Streptomyces]MCF0086655.1 hypothetical protein [Streptomyces sp. MH192]MCF0098809.1 hypothetical protein [Streptomyces sp. MH191]